MEFQRTSSGTVEQRRVAADDLRSLVNTISGLDRWSADSGPTHLVRAAMGHADEVLLHAVFHALPRACVGRFGCDCVGCSIDTVGAEYGRQGVLAVLNRAIDDLASSPDEWPKPDLHAHLRAIQALACTPGLAPDIEGISRHVADALALADTAARWASTS